MESGIGEMAWEVRLELKHPVPNEFYQDIEGEMAWEVRLELKLQGMLAAIISIAVKWLGKSAWN